MNKLYGYGIITAIILVVSFFLSYPLYLFLIQNIPKNVSLVTSSPISGLNVLLVLGVGIFSVFVFLFGLILLYNYVKNALFKKEKDMIKKICLTAPILFIIGFLFGYWNFVNIFLPFMNETNTFLGLEQLWNINEYILLLVTFTIGMGICFQLPLVLRTLINVGLLQVKKLKSMRGIVFIGLLVFGSIITPPDALSQLIVAIPLYVLFELSMIGIKQKY